MRPSHAIPMARRYTPAHAATSPRPKGPAASRKAAGFRSTRNASRDRSGAGPDRVAGVRGNVGPDRADRRASGWGDVVLSGRDLGASYHLAVTVDDALQGVTDVVRGKDLLLATSVHRLLQELLGPPAPRYRHHRLVLDGDGAKLSKSRRSPALFALRAQGVSAAQVRTALGFGGDDNGGICVALS